MNMETQIKSFENLYISKILQKNTRNSSGEYNFTLLAKEIMNKIYIDNGAYKYRPIEIEFYIYDKKNHPDIHVYPREAEAGDLFFHLSGVDICFESSFKEKEGTICFGGILIRALEREKEGEKTKLFGGPLTCVNELLNTATKDIKVMLSKPSEDQSANCFGKRKGINKSEKKEDYYWEAKYRFYRDGIMNPIIMEDETFDFGDSQANAHKKKRTRYYKIED